MSKSFRSKSTNRGYRDYEDDQEENYYDSRSSYLKRREKRSLDNAIRSKNIARLMELREDIDDDDDLDVRR